MGEEKRKKLEAWALEALGNTRALDEHALKHLGLARAIVRAACAGNTEAEPAAACALALAALALALEREHGPGAGWGASDVARLAVFFVYALGGGSKRP